MREFMHSKTVKFITATQLRHVTQWRTTQHIQAKYPKYRPKLDCSVTANVRSDGHSFPPSNADVCATDDQHRRSLSL